jgi:hypothetical protein
LYDTPRNFVSTKRHFFLQMIGCKRGAACQQLVHKVGRCAEAGGGLVKINLIKQCRFEF